MPILTENAAIRFSDLVDLSVYLLYMAEQLLIASGKPLQHIDLRVLMEFMRATVPNEWVLDTGRVLQSRGLADCVFTVGGACKAMITGEGRIYVESLSKQREEALLNAVDTVTLSTMAEEVQAPLRPKSLEEERKPAFDVLDQIRTKISQDESLGAKEKQDALRDIKTIREQLEKREPNRAAIAALLEPLSRVPSIAESIADLIRLLNP